MFIRRLSEQIMAQCIKLSNGLISLFFMSSLSIILLFLILVHEPIDKLHMWWFMNKQFSVKDNYSVQKILGVFFS